MASVQEKDTSSLQFTEVLTLLSNFKSQIYSLQQTVRTLERNVKNKIQTTIKDMFDESIQTFGFESFNQKIWSIMLDVVLYKEPFPHSNHLKNLSKDEEEFEKRENEIKKRYDKLRKDIEFNDISTLAHTLRFAFWGFLIPNASNKLAWKIIKEEGLITEQEIKEYKNGFKRTKPTENSIKKSGNTNQNEGLLSESKQGESSK